MKLFRLPYNLLFWSSFLSDQNRNYDNIFFDQNIIVNLNANKLYSVLFNLLGLYIFLNSNLYTFNDIIYWVNNSKILGLDIFNSVINVKGFVSKHFDLSANHLYGFGIIQDVI